MLLNGFLNEEEVRENFNFEGDIIYADKFEDNELDLGGCVIVKRLDGFYSVITRPAIEYGIKQNKFENMYFNIENVFNNLKFSMYYAQSISIKDLFNLLFLGV